MTGSIRTKSDRPTHTIDKSLRFGQNIQCWKFFLNFLFFFIYCKYSQDKQLEWNIDFQSKSKKEKQKFIESLAWKCKLSKMGWCNSNLLLRTGVGAVKNVSFFSYPNENENWAWNVCFESSLIPQCGDGAYFMCVRCVSVYHLNK